MNGFRACGIEPFNPQIFGDHEFAAAVTTDRNIENVQNNDRPATPRPEQSHVEDSQPAADNLHVQADNPQVQNDASRIVADNAQIKVDNAQIEADNAQIEADNPQIEPDNPQIEPGPTNSNQSLLSPWEIRPLSKTQRPLNTRQKNKKRCEVLTSSPVKNSLEEKEKEKLAAEQRKQERLKNKSLKSKRVTKQT